MHPIERLRYVARASGVEQAVLVRETATALGAFRRDPQGLVTACRRVIERQPTSGPLWCLCSRTLMAEDAMVEAWRVADEVEADPTPRELGFSFPDAARVVALGWPEHVAEALARRGDVEARVVDTLHEGAGLVQRLRFQEADAVDVPLAGLAAAAAASDLVVLEAAAVGPEAFVGVAGSRAAAAVAHHAGVPVWVAAGVGRVLPARLWGALAARLPVGEPWTCEDELVPLDLVDRIVGPTGPQHVGDAVTRADIPVAPELLAGPDRPGGAHVQA